MTATEKHNSDDEFKYCTSFDSVLRATEIVDQEALRLPPLKLLFPPTSEACVAVRAFR